MEGYYNETDWDRVRLDKCSTRYVGARKYYECGFTTRVIYIPEIETRLRLWYFFEDQEQTILLKNVYYL